MENVDFAGRGGLLKEFTSALKADILDAGMKRLSTLGLVAITKPLLAAIRLAIDKGILTKSISLHGPSPASSTLENMPS